VRRSLPDGCPSSLHGQSNGRQSKGAAKQPFRVVEATIPQMRAAQQQGRITSRQRVTQFLAQIALYEDKLHAAITLNPNAL